MSDSEKLALESVNISIAGVKVRQIVLPNHISAMQYFSDAGTSAQYLNQNKFNTLDYWRCLIELGALIRQLKSLGNITEGYAYICDVPGLYDEIECTGKIPSMCLNCSVYNSSESYCSFKLKRLRMIANRDWQIWLDSHTN